MKSFEDFKNEVQKMVDIYNTQDHWVDGKVDGLKVTLKPIFGDFSSDGYMPKYVANFIVYWGGKNPCKSGRYVEYNCRFRNYVSGCFRSPVRSTLKSIRGSFKKIFDI